ncbi:MAG: HDIG domain-containing protein [Candidatus Adiutrix sp.]|jgi:putative nucleotidyltransferase with HDIG domain|nr:HDIG domain-containing protein [Candidatus Adiutrix sp.]
MASRHTEMTKALSSRHPAAKRPGFRALRQKLRRVCSRDTASQAILLGLMTAVLVLLSSPAPVNYQVNDVAEYTIRADRAFRAEDREATAMQRERAAALVPPVLSLDDTLGDTLAADAGALFRRGRELFAAPAPQNAEQVSRFNAALENLKADFAETFRAPADENSWNFLLRRRFGPEAEQPTMGLAMAVMGQGLLDRPAPLPGLQAISIIPVSSRREYTLPSAAGLLDRNSAARFIDLRSRSLWGRLSPEDATQVAALAKGLIRPNLHPDLTETERRVAEAKNASPTVYFNVRDGEVIVREGSVIGPDAAEKIRLLNNSSGVYEWILRFAGLFVTLFVFFSAALVLVHLDAKRQFRPLPFKEQILWTMILVMVALLAHSAQMFGTALAGDFDFLENHTFFYAMPISTAAMVIAIFFGLRKAAFMALFAAVAAAVVTPDDSRFLAFLYCYNGAIAATWCLRNMNERGHLIPASFWVMVVNCLTLLGLLLLTDQPWSRQALNSFCAAAASGVLSGIIASGLIPLIEAAFGFNTNLKMLELGNLDRPVLRELMLSAPGTYHHSVIVGAMVEAAAECIGANPHLAKVGAYYHDIGKMKKPLYFVENQTGENRHDTLAPSMSALILIGHVRDGVELARAHGLPQGIVDIIEQHHGTSLMSFFYHKAKEQRQEGQPEVNEGDYRYPGPRPRGKEAGLVMLADICEAATRSLSEPTPVKIKNMVRQLVNQIFNDGQLDDCDLQTKEISEVINTFTTILIGIYHHRVAYPGTKKAGEPAADEKKEARQPGLKGDMPKEIYGHLPVEPSKSAPH